MATASTARFHGLDLLRFIAASLVVFYHFGYLSWAGPFARDLFGAVPQFPELRLAAFPGWVGVEVFFVISGFVIAYSTAGAGPRQFLVGRILRLAPALWVAAPITALVLIAAGQQISAVAPMLARSVVLFPQGPWVDGVYWTLCLEVVFYAGVFMLLAIDRRRWLEPACMVLGCVSAAACLAATAPGAVGDLAARLVEAWPTRLLLLANGAQFALGVAVYFLVTDGLRLRRAAFIALFAAAALAEIWLTAGGRSASAEPAKFLAAQGLWLACMGLFAAAVTPRLASAIARMGVASTFVTLGALTYPLYLIHQVVGWGFISEIFRLTGERWVALAWGSAAVFGLTLLIVRAERPVRRWLKLLLERGGLQPQTRSA
jgi:peptidoglycan/LPS O-acetylase OafA/YrhL